jgi:hypothetical protein
MGRLMNVITMMMISSKKGNFFHNVLKWYPNEIPLNICVFNHITLLHYIIRDSSQVYNKDGSFDECDNDDDDFFFPKT